MGFIYCITNNINQKKYVGLTIHSIKHRFKEHKSDSKRKRCANMPLYKAFKKYGIENFTIEALEETDNDKLSDREIYWIKKLGTYDSHNGYNATRGGQGGRRKYNEEDIKQIIQFWKLGFTITEIAECFNIAEHIVSDSVSSLPEFKEKTQETITQRIRKARGRKINQYTLNGEFVKSYDTISDAQKELGLKDTTQVLACCKNPEYTCHGFLFRYDGDTPPSKEQHYGKRRKVNQYDLQGNLIATYNTLTEASKVVDSKAGYISNACRGKQHTHHGYVWRYAD